MANSSRQDRFREAREVVQASDALHTAIQIAIAHEIPRDTFFTMAERVWNDLVAGGDHERS